MGSSLCQVQFHQSLLTSKRVELMMGYHLLVLMVAGLASSHEYFPEKCPEFQPMQGFDWDQFSNGVWSWTPTTPATRSSALVKRSISSSPRATGGLALSCRGLSRRTKRSPTS